MVKKYKTMKTRILLILNVVMLFLTSCQKEDFDAVFLKTMIYEITQSSAPYKITNNYEWDGQLLKSMIQTVEWDTYIIIDTFIYEYEGDKLVTKYRLERGKRVYVGSYDYDQEGRFMGAGLDLQVRGYDADGHITEIGSRYHPGNHQGPILTLFNLSWKEGNAVCCIRNRVHEGGIKDTANYSYDNVPSVYSHMPVALAFDYGSNTGHSVALFTSKNNLLANNWKYEYRDGRLVKQTDPDGITTYTYYYTDGKGN